MECCFDDGVQRLAAGVLQLRVSEKKDVDEKANPNGSEKVPKSTDIEPKGSLMLTKCSEKSYKITQRAT